MRRPGSFRVALAVGLACCCVAARFLPRGMTERASLAGDGAQAGGGSESALSGSGRIVAFASRATDLVPGDPSGNSQIYVRDLRGNVTTRISGGLGGVPGDGNAFAPNLSANGRWVVFQASSSNLVPGDGNGTADVFVHDRRTGATARVSITGDGAEANDYSSAPAISATGRVVAWESDATNLVPGDGNGQADVFVHDRKRGATTRVSVGPGGVEANDYSEEAALSGSGRWVAFASYATNLVGDDTNGEEDAFVHDRRTGMTERVSVATGGGQALGGGSDYPALSRNGRWVAFESDATNLVAGDTNGESDVFVHDRRRGITTRVSVGPDGVEAMGGGSAEPRISADGRFVLFDSFATNLVPDDANGERDVFLHDRRRSTTIRVSVSSTGAEADDWSLLTALSDNGRVVSFASDATNLVPGDTNGARDVFVRRW